MNNGGFHVLYCLSLDDPRILGGYSGSELGDNKMKKIEFMVQRISIERSQDSIPTYDFKRCVPINTPGIPHINKDIINLVNNMTGNKIKNFKMVIEWEEDE